MFAGLLRLAGAGAPARASGLSRVFRRQAARRSPAPAAARKGPQGLGLIGLVLGVLLAVPLTAWAAPTISSFTPQVLAQSGGTVVTFTGAGFTGATSVTFGGASGTNLNVVSDTELEVTAPAGSGQLDATINTGSGSVSTSGGAFVYLPVPTVTGISPSSGSSNGGTTVIITGTGFTDASLQVSFGGATVFAMPDSLTQITVTAPAGTPGTTVDVTVSELTGTSTTSAADRYTFVQAPIVSGISSSSGVTGGGGTITITGSHLSGATSVTFGGTSAAFTPVSDTVITATVPAHAAGAVDVQVTIPVGGTSAVVPEDKYTYLGAPTITGISPTTGPAVGGTSVIITGTNLDTVTGAGGVKFGATNAASYTVTGPTSITATSPAGSSGTVDVTVTNGSGTSPTSGVDQFTYVAPPTVTVLSPTAGPTAGGTSVTITGTSFTSVTGASGVKFGATNASSYTVNSDTQITAVSPAGTGTVDVTVTQLAGTSATTAADQYTFTPPPTVTAVSPTSGPTSGGTSVIITGTNLTGATSVTFGGVPATGVTVNSATQITATAPAGSGTVNVRVTTVGGTSAVAPAAQYTYVPAPTVTVVSPNQGPTAGGTSVIITGTNFLAVSASGGVRFGAATATYVINSDTQITATTPASAAATVDVTVTSPGGTSVTSVADRYTYVAPPTVSAVSPAGGPLTGGTSVVITGTNLSNASVVLFGGTAGSITANGPTSITATSPAAGAGTVDVRVVTVGGTSAIGTADQFTYTPPPTVSSLSPAAGPLTGGNSVTINGTNLTDASAVTFGGIAATSFAVVSASQITAVAPAGTGTVDVHVTTLGGTSASAAGDRYTYVPPPTVTGVSPAVGPIAGGGLVTITGTGFTGTTTVMFGIRTAAGFTVVSDSQITVAAPSNTGVVDVRVTNAGGPSATSAADRYTYANPPSVLHVSPAAGPWSGGTSVVISGVAFTGASAVTFGGASAAFVLNSDTQITATAPAGSGLVDVRVTTLGGTSATSTVDQFRYQATPTVTSLSPSQGPATGGVQVTITGTAFSGATAVSFGPTAATSFTVVNATQIRALAPPGTGIVDVTVTTASGTSATGAADHFAYVAGPAVTLVSPRNGPTKGGASVTLTGAGFTGASAVRFGTLPATAFTVVSDTQITATTPPGAGSVDITVVTAGGTSPTSAADQYVYVAAPIVSALSPVQGPASGGNTVIVHGSGFDSVIGVSFGGASALYTLVSDSEISATAPAGTGFTHVTVTTAGGTSAIGAVNAYAYVAGPAVTAVSPAVGPTSGGNSVTLQGSGFTGATAVSFGGVAAGGFTVNSAGQITATAPAGTGTVDITVTTPGGTSATGAADHYVYTAGPTVISVSPAVGSVAGGGAVTITGTGLTGATGVRFGLTAAASFTVTGATSITATPPPGSPGTVDVTVTTVGGTSPTGAGDHYQYMAAPVAGPITAAVTQDSSNNPIAAVLSAGTATSVAVGAAPTHGTLSVSGLGFVYTPASGYSGSDSFTYTATGVGGTSTAAMAVITVQPLAPTASTKAVTVAAGSGGSTTIDLTGQVSNATGIVISTPPQHGAVTVNHFVVTYTPTPGYFGADSFAFEAVLGGATSAPATVGITLADPTLTMTPATLPAAQSGVAYSQAVSAGGGTAPYSYQLIGTLPAGMSFNAATATISGAPTAAASASFQIKATDSSTGDGPFSITQGYTLSVTLSAPTVTAKAVTELAGQPVVIHAADGATGGPFTAAAISTAPSTGTTSISGTDITFTAPASFSGKVTFGYTLANATGTSSPATVTVTVNPVPTTPGPQVVQLAASKPGQADVTTGATGGPFTGAAIVSLSPSSAGTAQVVQTSVSGSTGTFAIRFTPALHFSGAAAVSYTLSNAYATSAPGTVTFQVAARPDPTQDPDVRGLVSAQDEAAVRFAQAQLDNINQRLEALHNARGAGNHYGMSFSFGDAAVLQSPEDMPWRRSDVLSMQRDASLHGHYGDAPQAYNAAAQTPGVSGAGAQTPGVGAPGGWGPGIQSSSASAPSTAGGGGSSFASGGGAGGAGGGSGGGDGSGAPGRLALWTGGAVDFGLHHSGGGYSGLHFTTAGVSVGGDYRFSDRFTAGVVAGYGEDNTSVGSDGTHDRATSYLGAAYASFHPSTSTFIDGVVGYGQLNFDTRRYDAADAETETGHRTGDEVFASVTAAWQYRQGRAILSPYGRLDVVTGHLDPFTETGGVGALAYARQSVSSFRSTLGLRGDYLVVTHDGVWAPHFRLEYQHEFDGAGAFDLQYADWLSGPVYHGQLIPLGQNHLVGGVGTDFSNANWLLSFDYKIDVTTNSDVTNQFVIRVAKKF